MENTEVKKEISPEKKAFHEKTAKMKELVERGLAENVNDAFKKFEYSPEGHTELKTVYEWNKAGKKVIKGSKALYLWSAPREGKKYNELTGQTERNIFHYPIAVFSNLQVTDK